MGWKNPTDIITGTIDKILTFVEENWLLIVIVLGVIIFIAFMTFINGIIQGK